MAAGDGVGDDGRAAVPPSAAGEGDGAGGAVVVGVAVGPLGGSSAAAPAAARGAGVRAEAPDAPWVVTRGLGVERGVSVAAGTAALEGSGLAERASTDGGAGDTLGVESGEEGGPLRVLTKIAAATRSRAETAMVTNGRRGRLSPVTPDWTARSAAAISEADA